MRRLPLALASVLALLLVGSATGVAAQSGDPEVTVGEPEVVAGESVTLTVTNLEPDSAVSVTLGEATAEGTANAEGEAEIEIEVGDEAGEFDGIVTVNGVDAPFSVLVAAAEEEAEGEAESDGAEEEEGDGTAAPTSVNAGSQPNSSNESMLLLAGAAGLFVVGGTALALRRNSVEI